MDVLQQIGPGFIWPLAVVGVFIATVVLLIIFVILRRRSEKRYSPLTENMLRSPGQYLEKQLSDLSDKLLFAILCTLVLPTLLMLGPSGALRWIVALIIAACGLAYMVRLLSQALKLRLAADGEEYTGQELNLLMRSGAWVFHDLPYQYGNIDHIVVSTGGVFAVETKTFRKPEGESKSRRLAKVMVNGESLEFPHFKTSEPIEQAKRHAKYLQQCIKKNTGLAVPVTPVVALPGWYVERTARSSTWVFNPKRGGPLNQEVRKSALSKADTERVASYVESVARSVPAVSKKMDPDASKHYDFWSERRYQDRRLD